MPPLSGNFLGKISWVLSVSKSDRLNADTFQIPFIYSRYIPLILLKRWMIFLKCWTQTDQISNSTGPYVTSGRISPFIDCPPPPPPTPLLLLLLLSSWSMYPRFHHSLILVQVNPPLCKSGYTYSFCWSHCTPHTPLMMQCSIHHGSLSPLLILGAHRTCPSRY